MKSLQDILTGIPYKRVSGDITQKIISVEFDSRKIKEGSVFVAIKGTQTDGHEYIEKAIEKGAVAIVYQNKPVHFHPEICYIETSHSSQALPLMASEFYNRPTEKLTLVGITGTNGKTTIATLLYNLFRELGFKTALISTIRILIDEEEFEATHTTPDPVKLNEMFRKMVDCGVEYCFMEVSSHAIDQNRISGLKFRAGIFTNITHDHLDYHLTFDHYLKTKKAFFDQLEKSAFALVNADDKNGRVMQQNTAASKHSYALKNHADFKARILENTFNGLYLRIGNHEFHSDKVGSFNASNLLAVFAAAALLGMEEVRILEALSKPYRVDGRFEPVSKSSDYIAIVDYAHTPDAMQNVIKTMLDIRNKGSKLITVFGCGGNRDKAKRPAMGKIAARYSDTIFITSDNPRNEDPLEIIKEIEKGIPSDQKEKCISIPDREQAIKAACMMAAAGDVILVAGKGHEKYQEINGVKSHFDDKEMLMKYLKS